MQMPTSRDNRHGEANLLAWSVFALGVLSGLAVIASAVHLAIVGGNRESDASVGIGSSVAFVVLLLGGALGGLVCFLGQKRKGWIGILLCVLPFLLSLVVARFVGGHP